MPSLIHAVEHHARDKKDLIGYLGILFMDQLSPLGWICDSKTKDRKGNASAGTKYWSNPNGIKQFHFRAGGSGALDVYDRYRNRKYVMTLSTESDCRKLVKLALS